MKNSIRLNQDLLNEDYTLARKNAEGEEEKICWGNVLEAIPDETKLTLKHEGISKAAGDRAIDTY